jgi:hypothetical protein
MHALSRITAAVRLLRLAGILPAGLVSLAAPLFQPRTTPPCTAMNEPSSFSGIGNGPFGVNWLLLPADSATDFSCPYRNAAAKVCRMR